MAPEKKVQLSEKAMIEGNTPSSKLWNTVCTTEAGFTKGANKGAYAWTAISPQYQMRNATALWGPYGKNWGLKNIVYEHIGHDADGVPRALAMRATFFYPSGESAESRPEVVEFEIHVDVPYRIGDDSYKKARTSAQSKALSFLGFNADVFMDLFDIPQDKAETRFKKTSTSQGGGLPPPASGSGSGSAEGIRCIQIAEKKGVTAAMLLAYVMDSSAGKIVALADIGASGWAKLTRLVSEGKISEWAKENERAVEAAQAKLDEA